MVKVVLGRSSLPSIGRLVRDTPGAWGCFYGADCRVEKTMLCIGFMAPTNSVSYSSTVIMKKKVTNTIAPGAAESGEDVNAAEEHQTPLLVAAGKGKTLCVQLLIQW